MRAKLALGAILVTGVLMLTHPAGTRTAAGDILLGLGVAAGCLAAVAVAGFACGRWIGRREHRRRAAMLAGLPRVAAQPAGRVTVHTPAGWPAGAPDCAAGCGLHAAVVVVYPDGRPDQPLCAGCWRDTAASEARAAGRRAPAAGDNLAPTGAVDPDFERVMREAGLDQGS